MIHPRKRGPFARLVQGYVRWKLRHGFGGLWVRGEFPAADTAGLLLYAHHTNFWDGFVAYGVADAWGLDGYALMEEANLQRYRFLRRLGAFSIRRGDPRSTLESLAFARRLLEQPATAVCLFPEGGERPAGLLPLRLSRGVEVLARRAKATCVPLAFRYVFFERELPQVLVEVGPAHPAEALAGYARRLEAVVERVFSARGLEGFRCVLRGRRGVAERWDAWRGLPEGRA
jgi:1-acyl-sn-glycerol-3-phosphate acyltransferase